MGDNNTSLHSAIRSFNGDVNPVKILLEHDDKDINVRNLEGETPLHKAVQNERCSVELINMLLEHGADVTATTPEDGNSALHWLAIGCVHDQLARERTSVIEILLDRGSDVNARNSEGCIPLHYAAQSQLYYQPLIGVLLERKSDVDLRNFKGDTPLHLYLQNKSSRFYYIRWFLRKSRDVNVANSKGETPLHLVVRDKRWNAWLIKLLLDRGADVGVKDALGENAYEAYCRAADEDDRRADPALQTLFQGHELQQLHLNSSLHAACLFHNVDLVHKLLKYGAQANAVDDSNLPPLVYALIAPGGEDDNCSATLKLMLDYGANVNYQVTFADDDCGDVSLLEFGLFSGAFERERDNSLAVSNTLCQHLAKILAIREKRIDRGDIDAEVLSQHNREFLDLLDLGKRVRGYKDWLYSCSEELKRMSEIRVGNLLKVSFLDFLLANENKTEIYARNKQLIDAVRAKKNLFPMYRGMLDAKLAEMERIKPEISNVYLYKKFKRSSTYYYVRH